MRARLSGGGFYGMPIDFPMDLSQQGDKLSGNFDGDKLEGTRR
jgi:hypothetical protein